MKKYFLVLVFLCFAFCVKAQSENNDETLIYKDSLPSRQEMLERARKSYGPMMISVGGGYGLRTAQLPKNINSIEKKYLEKLLRGPCLSVSAAYILKSGLGFGLNYNGFFASSKLDNVTVTYVNTSIPPQTGTISDKIAIQFFGPAIYYRLIQLKANGFFLFSGTLGLVTYKDDGKVIDPILITGTTGGIQLKGSYNFRVDPNIAVGFELSNNTGILTQLKVKDNSGTHAEQLKPDEYIGLQHIDFGFKISALF